MGIVNFASIQCVTNHEHIDWVNDIVFSGGKIFLNKIRVILNTLIKKRYNLDFQQKTC